MSDTDVMDDGRSGATLERVVDEDGRALVIKRSRPGDDLTVAATGGIVREAALWRAGVFDRLPAGVGHAILDVRQEGDTTVTIMRDLGDSVVGWRPMSQDEWPRVLQALAAVHRRFAGVAVADLCPLVDRVALLSPARMAPLAGGANPLPALVLRGWERFAELAPPPVATAVASIHADPSGLAAALAASAPATLLHADGWPVNVALEPRLVVFLDWAVATAGPAAVDLAVFLTGAADHVDVPRDEMIDRYRQAAGPDLAPATSVELALAFGLIDLGWNKALDATEHDDPAQRRRAAADLAWWCQRAGPTLAAGW